MSYENRLPPEGINVSSEHPLKEFLVLALGLAGAVGLVVLALSFLAGWLIRFVPFELERTLFSQAAMGSPFAKAELDPQQQEIQNYLQDLADRLAFTQGLPEGMSIRVHYIDDQTVNAFATVGGNVLMFRGLLQQLPHENALSMVMAHEIAHIKHRDPLLAMGRALTVGVALASLAGFADNTVANALAGRVALFSTLKYSRDQEGAADIAALETLQRHYGHVSGAEALFEVLEANRDTLTPPAILSTHPLTAARIAAIKAYENNYPTAGHLSEIPASLGLKGG